jgi:hypothetical protein
MLAFFFLTENVFVHYLNSPIFAKILTNNSLFYKEVAW